MSSRPSLARMISIFFSCADEDKEVLHKIERQLSSLVRSGDIECWHRHKLSPGSEWKDIAKKSLSLADIILLLISPDFISSDYCYGEEASYAMTRHDSGKAYVIPIIVRPVVEWEHLVFGELKSLPAGKAVSMWPNREEAFSNIVKGIKYVIDDLKVKVTPSADKPSVLWNIPYWRNPFFTGREDILVDLQSTFVSLLRSSLHVQALSGLAGVGKTQIAIEYAYRYRNNYQAVLWVHADAPEILLSSFVDLAEVLNLSERNEASQPLIVRAVKQWLQHNTHWLLIVDNLEDVDLLRDIVPSPHTGHILVTTRSHRTGHIARRIDVVPMEDNDGALLLLRRAHLLAPSTTLSDIAEAESAFARKIAQEVHGLPLALDQAGAYIEETRRGLSDYVSLYQQRSSSLLKRRGSSGQDHPTPVTTTFLLSFEKVKTQNPSAIELLEFCAFLHPDAIPEEMLIDGASALPSLLREVTTDPIEFDQAVEDLLKFSLIQREPHQRILIVHRLVQAVARDTISQERQQQYVQDVISVIKAVFPVPDFPHWSACQRYLQQAQSGAKLIIQQDIETSEAKQLCSLVGTYLYRRGVYSEAEALLLRASVIAETLLGSDHFDMVPVLNVLAKVYYEQGKYNPAELLLLRSLAIAEKSVGMEHPEIGDSLNALGRIYHKQGKFSDAEPLFQRALILQQKLLGYQHTKAVSVMVNLATVYYRQGKYDQSERLYREALTIRQATLDPQDPDIAATLNNLAVLYSHWGMYDQAEIIAKQAVTIYEQALGQEHPSTVNALDTLAEIYQEQGKYVEAEPIYQEIFSFYYRKFGAEHPQMLEYGNHLARLYFLQGKYVQAETTARQAFALGEKLFGLYHHRVGTAVNILADACKAQGKYHQAEVFYQQAIEIREKVLASNDINMAITLEGYADLLQTTGRGVEAEAFRGRAATIRRGTGQE